MDVIEQEDKSEYIQDSKNFQNEDFAIFELKGPQPVHLQHDQ